MSRRKLIILAVCAAVIFIMIISLFYNNSGTVVRPRIAPVVEAVYALGTVKTDRWYNTRFGMNTVIRKIYVVEGQYVATGDPLLMTDSGMVFGAPFSGTVTSIAYREHEMAPTGQSVISLSSLKELYVRVSLDQESIVRVVKGQKVELSFENLRDEKVRGVVESVYPSGDEFLVRVGVPLFPEGVLPEMTCDVAIEIRGKDRALLIPLTAVKNGRVTLMRKGREITVPVSSRRIDEKWTEVLDNSVRESDRIILREEQSGKKRKSEQ